MSKINGTKGAIYIDVNGTDTQIGASTNCSIEFTWSPPEITNKDSAGYETYLENAGKMGCSGSWEGQYDADESFNADEIFDKIMGRDFVKLNVGFPGSDYPTSGKFWEFNAAINSLKIDMPNEDIVKISFNYKSSGTITAKAYTTGGSMS